MSERRVHKFRPDFHQPRTLLKVVRDGMGLRLAGSRPGLSDGNQRFDSVWMLEGRILVFVTSDCAAVDAPFVKCLSKLGTVWAHANCMSVLVAVSPKDLPGQPEFFDPESSWV